MGPKCQEEEPDRSIGDEEESGEYNQLTIGLGDDNLTCVSNLRFLDIMYEQEWI